MPRLKRTHDTTDMPEVHDQSTKLVVERLSHQVMWHAVKQWHTDMLPQLHSLCRTTNSKGHRAAVHLEGHVPGSHIYSFFQFLGLSRGSFTLQATLMQNIVEHLDRESRKVLKRTGERSGTCLILLTTTSTIIYTICDYFHSAQSCVQWKLQQILAGCSRRGHTPSETPWELQAIQLQLCMLVVLRQGL